MFFELPKFTRCCFCMPLRKGVLTFGYLKMIFSMFMVGLYSYCVDSYYYRFGIEAKIICIALHCVDTLFNVLLVYGAHKQIISYLRIFYYYTLTMTIAMVLMEIVSLTDILYFDAIGMINFFLVGLCTHFYLLFLVRSLMYEMNNSGCANKDQFHQFVNEEEKGKYPITVVPIANA